MPIELIISIVLIACLVPLIIKFHPKEDDYKYTSSESYDDAHELAEKARRDHGQTSVLKAKSSSSAKTTMKESAKKSVAKKHKKHNADKKQVEKFGSNKESWQPYINMLRERYPYMSQYLVLRSWGHPTHPDEFDGGLALIRLGKIWYFCVDHILYTLGEETHDGYRVGKDEFEHNCYRLPDDFFDNTTWENLEDKLTAVNWNAGSAVSALFNCEAEDKAEIEKLFTRSPYRTLFKTRYEKHHIARGQRLDSEIFETKESTLSIHIETGELTEKTRCIVHEVYASEWDSELVYPYGVERFERAVSYDELAALIEASQDKATEQYRGMTADNWRGFFTKHVNSKKSAGEILPITFANIHVAFG